MTNSNDAAVEALKNAVSLAPNNAELANQLIKLLVDLLRYEEAEQAARFSLQQNPKSIPLQLAMAEIYCRQGKDSHALAIVETLAKGKDADSRAMVMHARLLQRGGDIRGAVSTYRDAVDRDDEVADPELESLLGIEDFREQDSSQEPEAAAWESDCLLYTSPSPRDQRGSRMPSSA